MKAVFLACIIPTDRLTLVEETILEDTRLKF